MARSPAGAAAADWRFVYVAEAHAQDEWPLRSARFTADGQPVVVDQPRTLDARLGLARRRICRAGHFCDAAARMAAGSIDPSLAE